MKVSSSLRVSIVIPVYNEAEHLAACLSAIAAQTVTPYQVIVVDNNSSDKTAEIAQQFPFVTLLHQHRQGVVYARDLGFNAAHGEIIGRLDADSLIAPNWVATTQLLFGETPELAAVSGKVRYYGLALSKFLDKIDLIIRRYLARRLDREVAMQGANMAVRRSAWQAVETELCRRGNMHEDFDISIHLAQNGELVSFDERLDAAIDCRRLESNWREFRKYAWLSPATYAQHNLKSRRHMYPIVMLAVIFYLPLKMLHKGYNAQTRRFSWRLAFSTVFTGRVNPATYVD